MDDAVGCPADRKANCTYVQSVGLTGHNHRQRVVGRAQMENLLWWTAVGEIAGILERRIPWLCELPVQQEGSLPRQISCCGLGWPKQREPAGRRPVGRNLSRPRQLNLRVVPMTFKQNALPWVC